MPLSTVLLRVAAGAALLTLLPSMILGYSGSSRLAGIGNTIFLLGLLVVVPLTIVGLAVRLGRRKSSPS